MYQWCTRLRLSRAAAAGGLGALIDVVNVETAYFDNCIFFALTSFLLQFCLIHLSLASLAFCATYFTFLSGVFIVLSCWFYPSKHFLHLSLSVVPHPVFLI